MPKECSNSYQDHRIHSFCQWITKRMTKWKSSSNAHSNFHNRHPQKALIYYQQKALTLNATSHQISKAIWCRKRTSRSGREKSTTVASSCIQQSHHQKSGLGMRIINCLCWGGCYVLVGALSVERHSFSNCHQTLMGAIHGSANESLLFELIRLNYSNSAPKARHGSFVCALYANGSTAEEKANNQFYGQRHLQFDSTRRRRRKKTKKHITALTHFRLVVFASAAAYHRSFFMTRFLCVASANSTE